MPETRSTEDGERDRSTDSLMPQLYDDLCRLARARMRNEAPGQTISGTALVHEAYLRLNAEGDGPRWKNERQFFSAAAEMIRRILIDRIRAKRRLKRGQDPERVELDEEILPSGHDDEEILSVHEVLDELAAEDPESAELVRLRFFVGLTVQELSEVTGIPVRSLNRQWAYARAWLARRLSEPGR
nr:ECF-type sigma factor [Luteolibacter marinus]